MRVYPVQGEVFYKNQPAKGALVHFHPRDSDKKNPSAFATVSDDGTFQMSTFGVNDGAAAGEYVVTINWRDQRREEGETIFGPDKLGGAYGKVEHSPLKATVEGKNTKLPRFDLK